MNGRRGFSILEVLIAVAIVSVAMMTIMTVVDSLTRVSYRQAVRMAALRLSVTLIDLISLPATSRAATVQSDVPGMDVIWRQFRGWEKADHYGTFEPIPLFLPQVERLSPTSYITGGQLTGTPTAPLRYNLSGLNCAPAIESCPADTWPIEVYTEFNFNCPPIFHKGYDDWLRDGFQFPGAIYPAGLDVPSACISKSDVNIRLTIRESVDGAVARGFVPKRVEIITLPMADVSERQ